jgi:hypothetical protein
MERATECSLAGVSTGQAAFLESLTNGGLPFQDY